MADKNDDRTPGAGDRGGADVTRPMDRIQDSGTPAAPYAAPVSDTLPPTETATPRTSRMQRMRASASKPWVPVAAIAVGAALVGAIVTSAIFVANPVHENVSTASSNSALPQSGGQNGSTGQGPDGQNGPGSGGQQQAPNGQAPQPPNGQGPDGKAGPGGPGGPGCAPAGPGGPGGKGPGGKGPDGKGPDGKGAPQPPNGGQAPQAPNGQAPQPPSGAPAPRGS